MTTTRTHQLSDHTRRSAGMWIVAITTAVLALAMLLVMTSTAAATGTPGCPPPSAQLTAAQSGASSDFNCTGVVGAHFNTLAPTPVGEPVDVTVVGTPTGTTTPSTTAP